MTTEIKQVFKGRKRSAEPSTAGQWGEQKKVPVKPWEEIKDGGSRGSFWEPRRSHLEEDST